MKLFLFGITLAAQAFAGDYPANHCEIFVDKANVRVDTTHRAPVRLVELYVKLDLHQLHTRGGIKSVAFKGIVSRFARANGFKLSEAPITAHLSLVAKDYYRISFEKLEPIHESTFYESFEGSFYVETKDGTKLWANASYAGENFKFDYNTVAGLAHAGQMKERVGDLTKTADYPVEMATYYNRLNCR